MKLILLVQSSLTNSMVHLKFCFPWNQTLVTCPTQVLWLNRQTTTGGQTITMIITDKFRLPSLVEDPGGISLETKIDQRKGGDRDQPLHPPLQLLHLQTLERESWKDLNIPIRREEADIHLLLLPQYHSQVHDYGRYQRSRYSPQAVQNPQVLQPEEIPTVQTMTSEQTMPCPSRDSGSDNEMENWSFDRAINEVLGFCPRSTEQHTSARPLSGIAQLMESQSLFYEERKIYTEFNYFFFFFLSFYMLAIRISMQSRKLGRCKKAVADALCFPLILRT